MTDIKADQLREALKPFASLAEHVSENHQDSRPVIYAFDGGLVTRLTVGDLRRAKAALAAPQPPASNPNNLPDTWEYQAETNCVVCSGCGFRYGAEHPDGDGKWTCPNCGDGNSDQSAKTAAPLGGREAVAKIIYDAFPFEARLGHAQKPAWVEGGSSLMQGEARRAADAILAVTPAAPVSDDGTVSIGPMDEDGWKDQRIKSLEAYITQLKQEAAAPVSDREANLAYSEAARIMEVHAQVRALVAKGDALPPDFLDRDRIVSTLDPELHAALQKDTGK